MKTLNKIYTKLKDLMNERELSILNNLLIELNNKKGGKSHKNLKGVTNTYYDEANKKYYEIFILFGLPEIEFESVLAHELFHVWLYENPNSLSTDFIEATLPHTHNAILLPIN